MTVMLRRARTGHTPGVDAGVAGPGVAGVGGGAVAATRPTAAQILRHGDHGLGALDSGLGDFVVLRGRCFTLRADFTAEATDRRARAASAAITRFRPEHRMAVRRPQPLAEVAARIDQAFGDDGPGAFRIDAWFSYVRLLGPNAEVLEVSDVVGSIVGFRNVAVEADRPDPMRLHFLDGRCLVGGRVADCEVLRARVELATITPVGPRP